MASFARINGDRLFELRAGNGNNCRYDEFIQRLTDLAKADIKFEHDYLQSAVEAAAQKTKWAHKIDNSMVNTVQVIDKKNIIVSTMDGKVVLLQEK